MCQLTRSMISKMKPALPDASANAWMLGTI
jgi:hypothetical protein